MKNLVISFSGGETSAYMASRLISSGEYDNVYCLFANTGQEREETLEFVDKCDKHFGLNVVWLESVVHHGRRKGTTHKVVSYETASRAGEPFEEVIKKYGIPNKGYPHCTRELKINPMDSWIKENNIQDYSLAIGIRADEIDRMRRSRKETIYPLVGWGITKLHVNDYWRQQPFRLNLKGYEGNCAWCWKKSKRKHFTLINENIALYDFPAKMEELYSNNRPERGPQVFFRGYTSTKELITLAIETDFEPASDDSDVYLSDWDSPDGCEESCEVE